MIETTFQLRCNQCNDAFNDAGEMVFDRDILSPAEVRKAAKIAGWCCVDKDTDLCAECLNRATKQSKKPKKPKPLKAESAPSTGSLFS